MKSLRQVHNLGGYWDVLSSVYSGFEDLVSQAYGPAIEIFNRGLDASWEKVEEAQSAMREVLELQSEVDAALEMMPPGPARTELINKREDSKGFFSDYVAPAWQKFSSFVGLDPEPVAAWDNMTLSGSPKGFGAVPVIAVAGVIAAVALSTVAYQYIDLLKEIKNDPNLTSVERGDMFKFLSPGGLFSEVGTAAKEMKWPLIIGGVAVLSVVFFGQIRKTGKAARRAFK